MLLIGHRGCAYPGYNQNTLRAFKKVTEEHVPAIEFDVQLSGDQQLVVIHNLDLEEVSTGKGKVNMTDSQTLKSLFAGNPENGEDRIPFLTEVLDFFASVALPGRPAIHLELKGDDTGKPTGELIKNYIEKDKLQFANFLISSFNWQELKKIRTVCPDLKIALLDGAIKRSNLLTKTGEAASPLFESIFAYGGEEYMLPQFPSLQENLNLLEHHCKETKLCSVIADEITACLQGHYYTESLLDTACYMNADSVNLWFRTVSAEFIHQAHERNLAVYVYTVNDAAELLKVAQMGVDGIFTDFYTDTARVLDKYL